MVRGLMTTLKVAQVMAHPWTIPERHALGVTPVKRLNTPEKMASAGKTVVRSNCLYRLIRLIAQTLTRCSNLHAQMMVGGRQTAS